jgi:lipoprotein signal peptidase
VFLLLDQWSKRVVQSCVRSGRDLYRRDSGARAALVLVWLAALISAIILHRSGTWFQSHLALLALGTAFGGAAGNRLDILRQHFVIDFIDLRWWPVFNLADVAIVAGLVTALWRPV